jgi:hypothetical protein
VEGRGSVVPHGDFPCSKIMSTVLNCGHRSNSFAHLHRSIDIFRMQHHDRH